MKQHIKHLKVKLRHAPCTSKFKQTDIVESQVMRVNNRLNSQLIGKHGS